MPTLSTLAKALNSQIDARTSDCALIELGLDDSPGTRKGGSSLVFQYYPETITDTKAVNYQQKEIFGASLPLYQWVSGGERLISFQAIFTCDVDLLDPSNQENRANLYQRLKNAGQERRNVDIRAAVVWLRGYMLPSYGEAAVEDQADASKAGAPLTYAPRKLLLCMPGTGIGFAGGDDGLSGPDTVPALMTQCDVTHEALFPSGLPRITTVQLAFAQIGQIKGAVRFPSRTYEFDEARTGSGVFLGYNFPAKGKIWFR
jgi:hypothetical protein